MKNGFILKKIENSSSDASELIDGKSVYAEFSIKDLIFDSLSQFKIQN